MGVFSLEECWICPIERPEGISRLDFGPWIPNDITIVQEACLSGVLEEDPKGEG